MARAPTISIQFKADPEEQCSSGSMLVAARVEAESPVVLVVDDDLELRESLIDAVNRAGVHNVLLKNMHAVQIRDEIEGVALDALRQRLNVLQV